MMSADSIHFPDSLKFKTHKLERVVYGGGGVMPDYFVPVDTTLFTKYHSQLSNKGVLLKTHYRLMDAHRSEWKDAYKDYGRFHRQFEVSDKQMKQLIEEGEWAGIAFNEEQYKKSAPLIKLQMKALIARDLWDMNEYYHTINAANESVKKALELLKKPGDLFGR
jgi:carboxyl-terminal processing protease